MIAGYVPTTDVVPHSMVDLDMEEIAAAVGNSFDFATAKLVYQNGGGGLCTQADIDAAVAGDSCEGKTTGDDKYADTYAMAALDGTGVMAGKSDVLRGELVK